MLVFISGVCVFFYQSFGWLKNGVWEELPLLKLFNYFFEDTSLKIWFEEPNAWFGLHQIVSWILKNIPISMVLILEGIIMISVFGAGILIVTCYRLYFLSRS